MTPTKVYPGFPLDRAGRWVGITEDHRFVTGQGDEITPVGGWGKHPLAHLGGIEMMFVLLQVDSEWSALTKAQQRCLLNPGTRSKRPWAVLTGKGLADDAGLTTHGWFLKLAVECTQQRSERAA